MKLLEVLFPRFTACAALALLPFIANVTDAAPPSFKVTRVFSNMDGTQQFIQLDESAGLNGQHHFAGLTLTITDVRTGIRKELVFHADLPSDQTAGESVLIATGALPYLAYAGLTSDEQPTFDPDFFIPRRFVLTEGATIDFAGADEWRYPPLPIDGWHGVSRDETTGPATFRGYHRDPQLSPSFYPATILQSGGTVIEYHNADLDRYFITALAADIDAIESGRIPGWVPTGETFEVAGGPDRYSDRYSRHYPDGRGPQLLDQPVCRFYSPPGLGNSHFLSADPGECEAVRTSFPGFIEESKAAFYARLPDPVTGACPLSPYGGVPEQTPIFVPWRPVYRLWSHRVDDSSHRYTTSIDTRARMIAEGYVPEGYGPGIAFCVGPPVF